MSYRSELPPTENSPTSDGERLRNWIGYEFQKIAGELETGVEHVFLPVLNVAPDKPRDGMIVLVDVVNFNPGAGAGFYGRSAGAWVKLG